MPIEIQPFLLRDCALLTMATGRRARNLRELRDHLAQVGDDSLYYHFYDNLLQPSFDDPEFRNDFALWARRGLHELLLAERLGMINSVPFADIVSLRRRLLEIIDQHLAERPHLESAPYDDEFQFLSSRLIVFDAGVTFKSLFDLTRQLPQMSAGSIFYHFIEARRRNPDGRDDFSKWIDQWGDSAAPLVRGISRIDFFFSTLPEMRELLHLAFSHFLVQRHTHVAASA